MIRKEGKKFVLYTADGSRKLGEHATREDADKQEMAIKINEARAGGANIKRPSNRRGA